MTSVGEARPLIKAIKYLISNVLLLLQVILLQIPQGAQESKVNVNVCIYTCLEDIPEDL